MIKKKDNIVIYTTQDGTKFEDFDKACEHEFVSELSGMLEYEMDPAVKSIVYTLWSKRRALKVLVNNTVDPCMADGAL